MKYRNPYIRPLEGHLLADEIEQLQDNIDRALAFCPDDGMELDLDALFEAKFVLDPPSFLLTSVKRK